MKYPQLVSGRTVSGIGGWLSTELESHGLDGRVYARLVLSLLHAPVEFSASDLQEVPNTFENRKTRKRIQALKEDQLWYETNYGLWTPDQVKRYAAVECLKSASEKKAGIESLVDELCVKLREIENEQSFEKDSHRDKTIENNGSHQENPVELAKKYYAAFPALSGINEEEKTLSLNPEFEATSAWLCKTASKATVSSSDKYFTKKKAFRKRSKMWKETDSDRHQQNIKLARNRVELGKKNKGKIRGRPTDVWDTDWEFGNEELLREYINNQCDSKDEGYDTPVKNVEKDLDDVCFNREWIYEYELNSKNSERPETVIDEINMAKFKAKFNESVEALWKDKPADCSIDELNLPVDFQDLLSSPSDTMFGDVVDGQGKNNKSKRTGARFMKNSIWSENFNEDENDCINNEKSFYPRASAASDEYKHQLELVRSCWENSDMESKNIKSEFSSMPWQLNFASGDLSSKSGKWSDMVSQNFLNTPYRILNHNKHLSSFSEVIPKGNGSEWPAQIIMDNFAIVQKSYKSSYNTVNTAKELENIDDDLLTSPKTHFRPIKEDGYADGTTFAISSALDTVNYRLCDDGMLAITSDTQAKRYMVYKQNGTADNLDNCSKDEFIVKFCVQQISKACQTDELMFDLLRIANISEETANTVDSCCCCCCDIDSIEKNLEGHYIKTGDYDIFDKEIQQLGARKWCSKCSPSVSSHNNNNIWNTNWISDKQLISSNGSSDLIMDCEKDSADPLIRIWSSDEKQCFSCENNNLVSDVHELKSELRKDGEEILSDLSYMQSLYIGSKWDEDEQDQTLDTENVPMESETPFDVNKLISNFIKPGDVLNLLKNGAVIQPLAKEGNLMAINCQPTKSDRKRRHSSTTRNHKEASGECKKPHCKFSHEITSMPCQPWADNSCQPYGFCPYQHTSAYARPLTR